jgi:uncharacterized damage-inducible protein DinB
MYKTEALLDLHERAHRSLQKLLAHCRGLSAEESNRELPGFGYPSVRLQLYHTIGAEEYWIGVLRGDFDAEDNEAAYPTVESLEAYRQQLAAATDQYLRAASREELNPNQSTGSAGENEQGSTVLGEKVVTGKVE